ncbi:sensor histidine kinase [Sphingomonas sp. T9W2]|uniref:sensor histidine kinase n=1 Tax=Sphingomonas sp. T9W2 TaxID=3143183 RepID=UPI0031F5BD5E
MTARSSVVRRLGLVALAGGPVVLAAMAHARDRRTARRLAWIERQVAAIADTGKFNLLDAGPQRDTVAALTSALNRMLGRLQDRTGQLELRAFDLGRAESRTAMAHNIRNGLSPISAILSHSLAQPAVAERGLIERAVTELGRDDLPPDRRAKLVEFVLAAVDAVARARVERLAQFETGRSALANVLDIVGDSSAGEGPVCERCDVTDLIARNAAIARYGGDRSIAVAFPARSCWVSANRVILSQVIGNLFRNAAEAIAARTDAAGQIDVTLLSEPGGVSVVVTDDGEGFAPDAAARLFQRGYSTRLHRSGGLGLHWCANAVAAMGGHLRLESDGPGLGAHAILTLPAAV